MRKVTVGERWLYAFDNFMANDWGTGGGVRLVYLSDGRAGDGDRSCFRKLWQ